MTETSPHHQRRRWTMVCWFLSIALLGVFLAPGFSSFESPPVESALHWGAEGRLGLDTQPSGLYVRAPNGLYYSVHEPGSLIASLPFAYVATKLGATPDMRRRLFELFCSLAGAVLFAGTLTPLMMLVRGDNVEPERLSALLVVAVVSSQFIIYQGSLADVSVSAFLFSWLLFFWKRGEQPSAMPPLAISGLLAGLLGTCKITNLAIAATLLILAAKHERRIRALAATAAGLVAGLTPLLIWNWIRTGSPLSTPYQSEFPGAIKVNLPLLPTAALGSLFSPGKGLFVYTPLLILLVLCLGRGSWARQHPRSSLLILGSLALTMLRIDVSDAWTGFGGWGIRYYVPWIPLLVTVVLLELRRRRSGLLQMAFAALLVAGLTINGSALITNFHYRQALCGAEPWHARTALTCAVAAAPANLGRTFGLAWEEIPLPRASLQNQRISNRLALWWYAVRYAGVSPLVSWGVGLAICGSAVVLAGMAWRMERMTWADLR